MLYFDDCLHGMLDIADESVQMILTDLPFGTTACKWDHVIPAAPMWEQFTRIIKPDGAIVLFCQQPFTSYLISSNPEMFKYMWYWRKSRPSGFVNCKLKPLKDVEEIAVFSKGTTANKAPCNMKYNPQGLIKVDKEWSRPQRYGDGKGVNPTRESHALARVIEFTNYPRQVLDFPNPNKNLLHPTQKPVDLCEYLISTYTDPDDVVLDACAGSGTTCVAAINTVRRYIAFENNKNYYDIAQRRINAVIAGQEKNEGKVLGAL